MFVKLKFRQKVAQGHAEECSGREGERTAVIDPARSAPGFEANVKARAPAGIIREKPRLTRCAAGLGTPARSIS